MGTKKSKEIKSAEKQILMKLYGVKINMEKTKYKTEFLEPSEAVFTKIERAEIVGYVAYANLGGVFAQMIPQYEHKTHDVVKWPWGMFKTQQDAVDLCRKIYPSGCDLKIFKIIL